VASRVRHEKAESKRAKQEDRTRLKSVLSACNWRKETADPESSRAARGLWLGTETQGNADRDRAWGKEPRHCPEAGACCAWVCVRAPHCATRACTCVMHARTVCALGDTKERCSKKRRVEALKASCINGFDGKPIAEMERRHVCTCCACTRVHVHVHART
jgi:hypothetical protein